MGLGEAINAAKDIGGWLTEGEGELLYDLARGCSGRGVIVEIGSWKGKSTVYLSKGSAEGKMIRVYAVDPHTGSSEHQKGGEVWTFDEFQKNIAAAGTGGIVSPIVKTSKEAVSIVNEPVELLFIDGAHDYESVKLDFQLWFPKVIDGGVIVFHDTTTWDGPKKVVSEYVYRSRHFRNIRFVDSITYGEKVAQNSLLDCVENRAGLFLKGGHDFAARQKLPNTVKKIGRFILKILR